MPAVPAPLLCPQCRQPKVPDSFGHKHTGHLCFWCGWSTDRETDEASVADAGTVRLGGFAPSL